MPTAHYCSAIASSKGLTASLAKAATWPKGLTDKTVCFVLRDFSAMAPTKRKKRSEVWQHFTECKEDESKQVCKYCQQVLVGGHGKGTKGMWNHLRACKEKPEGTPVQPAKARPSPSACQLRARKR